MHVLHTLDLASQPSLQETVALKALKVMFIMIAMYNSITIYGSIVMYDSIAIYGSLAMYTCVGTI